MYSEKITLSHFTPVPEILQPAKPFNFEKVIEPRYQAIAKSKVKVVLRKDVVAERKALGMVRMLLDSENRSGLFAAKL
jgi:hypothetical protein